MIFFKRAEWTHIKDERKTFYHEEVMIFKLSFVLSIETILLCMNGPVAAG